MKQLFDKIIKHTSDVVSFALVYGTIAYVAWWLFDEELVQVAHVVTDYLDRIF